MDSEGFIQRANRWAGDVERFMSANSSSIYTVPDCTFRCRDMYLSTANPDREGRKGLKRDCYTNTVFNNLPEASRKELYRLRLEGIGVANELSARFNEYTSGTLEGVFVFRRMVYENLRFVAGRRRYGSGGKAIIRNGGHITHTKAAMERLGKRIRDAEIYHNSKSLHCNGPPIGVARMMDHFSRGDNPEELRWLDHICGEWDIAMKIGGRIYGARALEPTEEDIEAVDREKAMMDEEMFNISMDSCFGIPETVMRRMTQLIEEVQAGDTGKLAILEAFYREWEMDYKSRLERQVDMTKARVKPEDFKPNDYLESIRMLVEEGIGNNHVDVLRGMYGKIRDAMLEVLSAYDMIEQTDEEDSTFNQTLWSMEDFLDKETPKWRKKEDEGQMPQI